MIRGRRTFTKEFKQAAIGQVREGKSVAEVAKACEVRESVIYAWIEKSEDRESLPRHQTRRQQKKSGPRRIYTEEYKRTLAQQVKDGRSAPEVARAAGIGRDLLYKWLHRYFPEERKPVQQIGLNEFGRVETRLEDKEQEQRRAIQEQVGEVDATLTQGEAERQREETEQEHAERKENALVQKILADPLAWMQKHTHTKDSHWREAGASSPYREFPDKPYFRPLADAFQREPVMFIEKSRDMMISWLCVGLFTHAAMTTPGIEVLFQSQKIEKAKELIEYAKILYQQQDAAMRRAYPLKRGKKADDELVFQHGSRIIAIPGGGDQIRSYHPWGLLQDEAAFMPEAGEAYDHAVPVCEKIVVVSSAGPGWFSEQCQIALDTFYGAVPKGVSIRRMADERPVYRVHYSADPERGAAWAARERKKYSSQGAWDREQEIIHEAGGGERLFADLLNRYAAKILIDPYTSGFQPSPHWKKLGGFDHGKANPTGAIAACIDHDGVIYILGEYYQPELSPAEHRPNLMQLRGFMEAEVYADPSIFYQTQAQEGGKFKAISELYADVGIKNLIRAPETHELLGMERILAHWHDLDHREPTLKIVCPMGKRDISRPVYGVHNDGCPNLLWELRRTRRQELSATQLMTRNPTEKIVDKDNHLRDPLKYLCLALPAPTEKTLDMKFQEAYSQIPKEDATSRMIWYYDALWGEKLGEQPVALGNRGRWLLRRRNQAKAIS